MVRCTARPPKRSTPPRRSFPLDPSDKPWRRRFLQDGVDDGEQFRDPLDLIDHHGPGPGRARKQFPKALGAGAQAAMQGRFEQVQEQRTRKLVPQPRGLAGAAGTE